MYEIKPITVQVRREEVSSFAASLGLGESARGGGVPWTYPAIWLAHSAVRSALFAALRKNEVPVHESQEFRYSAGELTIDATFVMQGNIRREESPDKVRIVIDLLFMKDEVVIVRLTCRLSAVRSIAGPPC